MIELATSIPGAGPAWVTWGIAILGASGFSAILVVWAKGRVNRRNLDAKADLTDAERESFTVKSARELMDDMRKDTKDLRTRIDDCETDRAELHRLYEQSARELAAALKRITSLEVTISVYEARLKRAGEKTDMERT